MMANAIDKEQIETISKWWNDYGKSIAMAIVVGLVIGLGWYYWQQHKKSHSVKAAAIFDNYYLAHTASKTKQAKQQLQRLQKNYADTPYSAMASLLAAASSVESNDNVAAIESLSWVVQHGTPVSLQQIARVRLARVLIAEKKYVEAHKKLNKILVKSFTPLVESTRGDVYAAQGKSAQARAAYLQAQQAYREHQLDNPLLDRRINSLS